VHDFSKTGDEKSLSCAKVGLGKPEGVYEELARSADEN